MSDSYIELSVLYEPFMNNHSINITYNSLSLKEREQSQKLNLLSTFIFYVKNGKNPKDKIFKE